MNASRMRMRNHHTQQDRLLCTISDVSLSEISLFIFESKDADPQISKHDGEGNLRFKAARQNQVSTQWAIQLLHRQNIGKQRKQQYKKGSLQNNFLLDCKTE